MNTESGIKSQQDNKFHIPVTELHQKIDVGVKFAIANAIESKIRKVVIDFQDYLRLLETIEDEGLVLAMKEVENEKPLNLDAALADLHR